METILIFVLGVVVGVGVAWYFFKKNPFDAAQGKPAGKLSELNKAREEKVEENKEKILLLLQGRSQIKNKDVEETLSVSDATATRYLDELEKDGKIKQVGGEQKDTYYSKI